MLLKSVKVERYGCFGDAEFDFRRGLNLICGDNDTGKSLLLAALPAAVLGVDHGMRLRSWGDSLSCRVTLLFEDGAQAVRLSRDLESNLVRLQERGDAGDWRDAFAGVVPPAGSGPLPGDYAGSLDRLLGTARVAVLRALFDARESRSLLADDGSLADGLLCAAAAVEGEAPAGGGCDAAELARLEQDLAADRDDYRKGEEYLAWVRRRWQKEGGAVAPRPTPSAASGGDGALEKRRRELQAELVRHGLPERLPNDLPALFAEAETLRQELAALQQELTPLQRRRQGVVMPGLLWPLLVSLVALAAPGAALWLRSPWLLAAAAGGTLLLLVWAIFLTRYLRARTARDELDRELRAVEQKRDAALARQAGLVERFEACGLPTAPVEMVKLQQLCRRHEALISAYRDVCGQLGDGAATPGDGDIGGLADRHLRPDELPEAERRLAELGARIREREARLQGLRAGTSRPEPALGSSGPAGWSEGELLGAVAQQLERLSGGRFRELRFAEGRLRVEITPGRWAPPASCSKGTAACLGLALRLALARLAGVALPLLVDELPGRLDVRRRQAVLRTLERHAVDSQLLLASCDEELARRAVREHWPIINLNLQQSSQGETTEATDDGQLHLL